VKLFSTICPFQIEAEFLTKNRSDIINAFFLPNIADFVILERCSDRSHREVVFYENWQTTPSILKPFELENIFFPQQKVF
jgi:hypothetical protein